MDKDAIQEDAEVQTEQDQQQEQSSPRINARMSMMDEIAGRNAAAIEEELRAEFGDSAGEEEAERAQEPDKPQEEPKYKVKVDGDETEVPLSEILRGYQKDSAASRRLEEAARRQKELDEREAALNARLSALEQDPEPKQQASKKVDTSALLDAIYEGDRESAAKMLDEFVSGRDQVATQEQVDPAQVAALVKQQIVVEDALESFARDYSDVVNDPYLAKVADQYLEHELRTGKHTSYAQALKAAGDSVRDWVKRIAPAPEANHDASRTERLHRKEGMNTMPRAGAVRNSAPEPQDEETYRKSALQEILSRRQHRGR